MDADKAEKFTAAQRRLAKRLAGYGLTDSQVANCLETSEATLKRHCGAVLHQARDKQVSEIAQRLVTKARKGDTACMIFFLKARGGWRERMEVSGPNDGPIEVRDARQVLAERLARVLADRAAGSPGGAQ